MKIIYIIILSAIISTLGPANVLSQNLKTQEITLKQAINLALEHSHLIKSANAKTDASRQTVKATKAERLPQLNGKASYRLVDEIPTLEFNLPLGMNISREFGSKANYLADLSITQPIYTGGRLTSSTHLAEAQLEMNLAEEEGSFKKIWLLTRLDYFNLAKAESTLKTANTSYARTEIIKRDIDSKYSAGVVDSLALLEVTLAMNKVELQVQQAENILVRNQFFLSQRLGLDYDVKILITDEFAMPSVDEIDSDHDQSNVNNNLSNRSDLQSAIAKVKITNAQLEMEHALRRPTLSAYAGYTYGKPNADPFGNDWNDQFSVGAQLSWSLNLGGSGSKKTQSAKLKLVSLKNYQKHLTEQAENEIKSAHLKVILSYDKYILAGKEASIATQQFSLAKIKYQEGILSENRLLEIENSLTIAQLSVATTKIDFYIAESVYLYALGQPELEKGF